MNFSYRFFFSIRFQLYLQKRRPIHNLFIKIPLDNPRSIHESNNERAISFQNAVCSLQFTNEQSIAFQNAVCNSKYFTVCLYTKRAKTIGVGVRGQTTTHVIHVIMYSLVQEIRPPPSSSMKRKVIGLGNIEGPYPRA